MQPWKRRRSKVAPGLKREFVPWSKDALGNPAIYAGFKPRFVANCADWAIVNTLGAGVFSLYFLVQSLVIPNHCITGLQIFLASWCFIAFSTLIPVIAPFCLAIAGLTLWHFFQMQVEGIEMCSDFQWFMAAILVVSVGPLLIDSTYRAITESSRLQATIGKRYFGLYVAKRDGKRIGLMQAFARYLFRGASIVFLGPAFAGYHVSKSKWLTALIGFDLANKKQALHDKITRTYVLKEYDPQLLTDNKLVSSKPSPVDNQIEE